MRLQLCNIVGCSVWITLWLGGYAAGADERSISDGAGDPNYLTAWEETKTQMMRTVEEINCLTRATEDEGQILRKIEQASGLHAPPRVVVVREPQDANSPEKRLSRDWANYGANIQRALDRIPESGLLCVSAVGDHELARQRSLEVSELTMSSPHAALVPLLKAIASNPKEHRDVRKASAGAIGRIPHEKVIVNLIELLDSDDQHVRWIALRTLATATGYRPEAEREDYDPRDFADGYRAWWVKNEKGFAYPWEKMRIRTR